MTHRYTTLEEALAASNAGAVPSGSRIVVSWEWWDALSETERNAYQSRCDARGALLVFDAVWTGRGCAGCRVRDVCEAPLDGKGSGAGSPARGP